ncbi:MAG: F0F1 ATP synthase subunit A [Ignavibacteria bacterium]|nr:F0F1 ATP synthase subunit A [Ignavibacteria bacterium]
MSVPVSSDTTALHHAADSLAAVSHVAGEHNMFAELLHHVQDSNELEIPFGHVSLPQFDPFMIAGISFDMSITKHVVFLWISAALLLLFAVLAAGRNRRSAVPTGFGNLVEIFIVFIRDEIVLPNMGTAGLRYVPYLLTTFFFILIMNLAGLVPYGATATGNVSVTAGLAIIAFFVIQASAIRAQGMGHYLAHLTGGVHWILWPIMIPIEILGLFTKPFALCIRLFANMTGGHIVIVALFGLIFIFKSYFIAVGPFAFILGILMLEIFVAFLQAYIFTMLTALFMGLGIQAAEAHSEEGHA